MAAALDFSLGHSIERGEKLAVPPPAEDMTPLWTVAELEPIPAGDNPFWHDHYNMGSSLDERFVVMYDHTHKYHILVDVETGRQISIRQDAE